MGIVFGRTGISAANGLSPDFKVLSLRQGFEVRKYPPYVVAEVSDVGESSGDEEKDRGSAFQILAKYIGVFGQPANEGSEAMSMTAPVIMEKKAPEQIAMTAPVVQKGKTGMSFIMPNKYQAVEQLPKPTDARVKLRLVNSLTVFCLPFYGRAKDGGVSKLNELVDLVKEDTLLDQFINSAEPAANDWILAGYTPPFTLPPFQKQEVWIRLGEAEGKRVEKALEEEAIKKESADSVAST